MSTLDRKKTCFVIMPFGDKKDLDGKDIDFDDIYRFFLKKSVESLDVVCVRSDEISEAGSIHQKMFEHIYDADVVVVDITTANPNVFYELGVRHALTKGVTVLIRRKGTIIPFNINGLNVVDYDPNKFGSVEKAKGIILDMIKRGLSKRENDSPVHSVLELNIGSDSKPLGETNEFVFDVRGGTAGSTLSLITGDLQSVRGVDVWVNSENTNMQMARPYENSISGVIRYLGAKRSEGHLVADTIADALGEKMGDKVSVEPGVILTTTAGSLTDTHQVKKIFHAASVIGQVGKGYSPIPDVSRCVGAALEEFNKPENEELKSILFPLMGVRTSKEGSLEVKVKPLFDAAINYLISGHTTRPNRVCFLNYSDKELEVCMNLLKDDPRLTPRSRTTPVLTETHEAPTAPLSPTPPSTPTTPVLVSSPPPEVPAPPAAPAPAKPRSSPPKGS